MIVQRMRGNVVGLLITAILLLWTAIGQVSAVDEFQGVLIRLENGKTLSVDQVGSRTTIRQGPDSQSIVIWSDGVREAWQYVAPGATWSLPGTRNNQSNAANLFAGTRGSGQGSGSQSDVGQFTSQIVQLQGVTVFRGKSFLTPHNGAILNPRITIRRQPQTDSDRFPSAVAVLNRGNTEVARIPFAKDQQKVTYDQIPGLAVKHPQGLDAGEYTLRLEGGSESATFTIEDREWSDQVMAAPNRLADLLESRSDPLFLQVAVEAVLDQRDEDNKPLAYLTDALDLLESVPSETLTVHLQGAHADVLRRLRGEKSGDIENTLVKTGIPVIDRVRQLIAVGDWRPALSELNNVPNEPRAQSLAKLHRAEILAQSGQGLTDAAQSLFQQAIQELQNGSEADRFLAHNNYANFCLTQAQDRLYNHAFQMAAGVRQPLLTALTFWREAESSYHTALQLAESLDANQRSGVQVNAARLQVLLADIIRTLDASRDGHRAFAAGDEAADKSAAQLAGKITGADDSPIDPLIRASAQEIQAHLAFRARRADECQSHATLALKAYLDAGSLAGAEGIHRLLGLSHVHRADFAADGKATLEAPKEALKHLLVSMQLAELLRSRIPPDQFGLSQAGFFARRTYVNENVIQLLVSEGRAVEALHYAEQAKARSLQDLLATRNIRSHQDEEGVPTLEAILESWPNDVTAIEYFLGTERGWIFVIDPEGRVSVRELAGNDGTPVRPRELIADVVRFLSETNSTAEKMLNGAHRGEWQTPLRRFYEQLFPSVVIDTARNAKTVVIVPHHILHYLPFSALVVRPDPKQRSGAEVPLAQFLVDEPFDMCTVPSLRTWAMLRNRRQTGVSEVNAVGIVEVPGSPPLPGVETDIRNLREVFGDRVQQLVEGAAANESRVKTLLSMPGLLFVATHGHNDAEQPLTSYLLCQSDRDNDGHLTAAEIFHTELGASIVVMSACYSGLADQSPLPGDDLFGLQRAFLQSGTGTVVAGLWDVYDATGPLLMHDFFRNFANGQRAAAALANAQRTFLKQQREEGPDNPWLHPYFWAVYSVTGNDRTGFVGN